MKTCLRCGAQFPDDSNFCRSCGFKDIQFCAKCGKPRKSNMLFCTSCGKKYYEGKDATVDAPAEEPAAVTAPAESVAPAAIKVPAASSKPEAAETPAAQATETAQPASVPGEVRFCRQCGKQLKPNSMFCSSCGAKYVEEPVAPVAAPAAEPAAKASQAEIVEPAAEEASKASSEPAAQEIPAVQIAEPVPAASVPGEVRFCRQCGKQLKPNSMFCSSCGAKYIEEPVAPVAAPAEKAAPAEHVEPAAVAPVEAVAPVVEEVPKFPSEPVAEEIPEVQADEHIPAAVLPAEPEAASQVLEPVPMNGTEAAFVAASDLEPVKAESAPAGIRFCRQCGKQLKPSSMFCSSCGAKYQERSIEPVASVVAPLEEVPISVTETLPVPVAMEQAESSDYTEFQSPFAPSAPVPEAVPAPVPEEPQKPKKKKKAGKVIAIIVAIVLILAAGGVAGYWFLTKPSREYKAAEKAFDSGDYTNAVTHFKAAGKYQDAEERAEEVNLLMHYNNGKEAFDKGEYDKAKEEFTAAGRYKDAAARAQEAETASCYAKGVSEFNAGNYAAAVELFDKISGYKDSADQIKKCYFQLAEQAAAKNDPQTAIDYYNKAGDYAKASDKSIELFYKSAQDAEAAGNNEKAAEFYEKAGTYKDAQSKLKEIYYQLGIDALNKGDNDRAAEYLMKVGDYKDAVKKGQEIYYKKGCELLDGGKYADAAKYLSLIPNYSDVQQRLKETVQGLVTNKEYENARALADSLSISDGDSYNWKYYVEGMAAYYRGEYETATKAFAKVTKPKDFLDDEAKKCFWESSFEYGGNLMTRGDYKAARQIFTDLIPVFPVKTKNAKKEISDAKYKTQDLQKACDAEILYNDYERTGEQNYLSKAASIYDTTTGWWGTVGGFGFNSRKTYVRAKSSYYNAAHGNWKVISNTIYAKPSEPYSGSSYFETSPRNEQYIQFSYTENSNKTFDYTVTIRFLKLNSYGSYEYVTRTISDSGQGSFPFNKKDEKGKKFVGVDIDDNTKLTYEPTKDGKSIFRINYSETDYTNSYVYSSNVVFKK